MTSAEDGFAPNVSFDARWDGVVILRENWHFHRRLYERYGFVLAPADYSQIANAIRCGHTPAIKVRRDGSSVYLAQIPSSGSLVFIAAKPNGRLITALYANGRLLARFKLQNPKNS